MSLILLLVIYIIGVILFAIGNSAYNASIGKEEDIMDVAYIYIFWPVLVVILVIMSPIALFKGIDMLVKWYVNKNIK